MSASIKGKVGGLELEWLSLPKGLEGAAQVRLAGAEAIEVRFRKDKEGIWIETPDGTYGFDLIAEPQDEGGPTFRMSRRGGAEEYAGLRFMRAGTEAVAGAAGGKKRGVRVRAQMPGKIVRILVKEGAEVEKNQPLLVMEAMKMENEIRAAAAGKVGAIKVGEGQAVESGADLMVIE